MFMPNNEFNNLNHILICHLFVLFVVIKNIFYKYLDQLYLHHTHFTEVTFNKYSQLYTQFVAF